MFILKDNNKPFITALIFLFFCQAGRGDNQCLNYNVENAAWGFSDRQSSRFYDDATLARNQNLSDENIQARIRRSVATTYQENQVNRSQSEINDLASHIKHAAECTGNDFSILAGLLYVESKYCSQLLNTSSPDSSASGCGQFTVWPIRVFRNQLRLPGRAENGDPKIRQGIEDLLASCFVGREHRIDEFKELFSQSTSSVKSFLQSGQDFEMDLVATAIYLKFFYAMAGFYYNPGSRAAGALSRYGEGPAYARKVNRESTQVNACQENIPFLESIQEVACELSEDSSACYMTERTYTL